MSHSRFSFFPDPNESILQHADKIKIELTKVRGTVAISFEISGEVWPERDLDDDQDSDGELCTAPSGPDPAVLARSLLRAFLRSQNGGGQ